MSMKDLNQMWDDYYNAIAPEHRLDVIMHGDLLQAAKLFAKRAYLEGIQDGLHHALDKIKTL